MHKIHANGIEFSYLSYGEGPLLLCLHGFPDSAHTWDALGPRFVEMGYHVVAPFMRGYHPTEIPASNAYGAVDLGQDVLALIGALGTESAIVIGHDWGALAAHSAAKLGGDSVSKMVTLAIPHSRSFEALPQRSVESAAFHFVPIP